MITGIGLAIVTERITRVLSILETVGEMPLRLAVLADGCPAKDVGPVMNYLVQREVISRKSGYVELTAFGRRVVAGAKVWREQHSGAPIDTVTWK